MVRSYVGGCKPRELAQSSRCAAMSAWLARLSISSRSGRKSGSLLANLFRPFGQAAFEGYRLLLTPPLQHDAAPLLGAGGSAICLSATGERERDAADGEKKTSCDVDGCYSGRRNARYFRWLIEVFTQLSPLPNAGPRALFQIGLAVPSSAMRR